MADKLAPVALCGRCGVSLGARKVTVRLGHLAGSMPAMLPADGKLSHTWGGGWFTLEDGKQRVLCPITSFDEVDEAKKTFLADVPAQVHAKGSAGWEDVTLTFFIDEDEDGSVKGQFLNATKFEEVIKDVDVVLDSVAGETLARSYGVVKKGGIIVSLLEPPDKAQLDAHEIRGLAIMATPDTNMLGELSKLVEAKKLKAVVTKTHPLAEAAKAQEAIETGHTRGKIVLRVADEPKG